MVPGNFEGPLVISLAHSIRETIESANAWLLKSRSGEPIMSAQERAGVNLTILLNSACYVEGNLESLLSGLMSKLMGANELFSKLMSKRSYRQSKPRDSPQGQWVPSPFE
jgi:hypothetical protein